MRKRFPLAALMVLLVGLIVNAGLILLSFSSASIFFTVRDVNSVEQAKELSDQYLSRLNLELKVREIMEFSNHFYVMVEEKSTGINAFELLVDKRTGTIFSEPGPNMMWNTKYGHMGRMSNATAAMPLDGQEASEYAQRWLDRNIPGAEVEEPEMFYGYYTIDVSKNGQTIGMLSVNGYTGDIWYHTWHGQFIKMMEYD